VNGTFRIAVLVLSLTAAALASSEPHVGEAADLCAILASPNSYAGRLVTIRGQTEGPWLHSARIGDVNCRIANGMVLGQHLAGADEPSLAKLRSLIESALQRSSRDSLFVVNVTIIGRINVDSARDETVLEPLSASHMQIQAGQSATPEIPAPHSSHWKTVEELLSELETDPNWTRERDRRAALHAAREAMLGEDERELVLELRQLGFDVDSVYDLMNSESDPLVAGRHRGAYDRAYPAIREGIIRALTEPAAAQVASSALIAELRSEPNQFLRWAIANALRVMLSPVERIPYPEIDRAYADGSGL
jgi:hypothetical protein